MPALIYCWSCCRSEMRRRNALFCFECAAQRETEQRRAISAVNACVQRGEMPQASEHDCVDCGTPAAAYDHRDYTEPLVVQPVCAACNVRRGPALDSQCRGLPDMPLDFSRRLAHGSSICLREPLNATQQV